MVRRLHKKKKPRRLFAHPQWQTCYEHFLTNLPSEKTRELYDYELRRFFADGITPDKKSRADIETFVGAPTMGIARCPGSPPSPATQNLRLRIIASFYSWCSRYMVPFRSVMRPIVRTRPDLGIKMRKEPYSERDMEDGEAERLLQAIDTRTVIGARDYALLFALLVTGRRLNELCRLRWGDIQPTTFIEQGRARQGWIYKFRGKGHLSADDCAEWPAECMEVLRIYLELAGRWGKMQPDDPLFVSIAGCGKGAPSVWAHEPVKGASMDRRFRRYADAAGLPPERVIHSLRHESAWLRYENNGHDIQRVQEDLRHASVLTTMRYVHHRKRRAQGDPVAGTIAAKFRR